MCRGSHTTLGLRSESSNREGGSDEKRHGLDCSPESLTIKSFGFRVCTTGSRANNGRIGETNGPSVDQYTPFMIERYGWQLANGRTVRPREDRDVTVATSSPLVAAAPVTPEGSVGRGTGAGALGVAAYGCRAGRQSRLGWRVPRRNKCIRVSWRVSRP